MHSLAVAAFTAGLVSFLSPCVLPLVPGYISLISGTSVEELRNGNEKLISTVLLNSALFILGFAAVFVALGALATSLGQLVREHITLLSRLAGLATIALGLHQTGLLPIRLLYRDARCHGTPRGISGPSAFVIGSAFGFGWIPCTGPILAVILGFAAGESTVAKGVSLLVVYAAGLGIPFVLTALSIERFLAFYKRFQRHLRTLEIASGAVMIVIGLLIFTNHLVVMNGWMNRIPFFRAVTERFL